MLRQPLKATTAPVLIFLLYKTFFLFTSEPVLTLYPLKQANSSTYAFAALKWGFP